MAITFTSGISFSGGINFITEGPQNTAAWFGGGGEGGGPPGAVSRVDRITYATDTATASVRGPLSGVRYRLAAAGGIQ